MFCLDKYAFFEEELYFYVQHSLIIDFRIIIFNCFWQCRQAKKIEFGTKLFTPKSSNRFHLWGCIRPWLYPHFIHFILLSKEILLILKITLQNAKNVLQFLRKNLPAASWKPCYAWHIYCIVNFKQNAVALSDSA